MEAIAQVAAQNYFGSTPFLTQRDRFDAGVDGIVAYLADHDWPSDPEARPLFRAASRAIEQADRESLKHIMRGHFWIRPPGEQDALAEQVTDRVAIWQLWAGLTKTERDALWALASVLGDGGHQEAADSLGVALTTFRHRLYKARARCRLAWAAPGETLRPYYAAPDGHTSKAAKSVYNRTAYQKVKEAA